MASEPVSAAPEQTIAEARETIHAFLENHGYEIAGTGESYGAYPMDNKAPLAALAALVARAADAAHEAGVWKRLYENCHATHEDDGNARMEAEARAAAAEAERDKALRYEHDYREREADQRWEATLHRAERAEAETQRLYNAGRAMLVGGMIPRPDDPAEHISGVAQLDAALVAEFVKALAATRAALAGGGARDKAAE